MAITTKRDFIFTPQNLFECDQREAPLSNGQARVMSAVMELKTRLMANDLQLGKSSVFHETRLCHHIRMQMAVDINALSNAQVLDSEGRTLKLGQIWNSGPVILIFLRHFACMSCRAHASQVWKDKEQYQKNGSRIVFIGNGAPSFIDDFKRSLGLEGALILTDPSLESFRAAGLRNGYLAVMQMKTVVNAIKLAAEGHRPTLYSKAAGNNWQLGGIVALKQDGKVVYQYASESVGDVPDEDIEVIVGSESK